MPWCPKCKNEYREGFTVCSECNVELVDDLEAVEAEEKELVFSTEHKERIDAFIKYLEYSGIHSYSTESDENDFVWNLYVAKADYKKASKLYTGFALTESERAITGQSVEIITSDEEILPDDLEYSDIVNDNSYDTEYENENDTEEISITDSCVEKEDSDEISEERQNAIDELNERMEFNEMNEAPSSTYVRKSDKAKDYLSSAYTNIICGAVGLVFVALNMIGVISIISSFSEIIFLIMFALFLISGIIMYTKSKAIAEDADAEEKIENSVIEWLNTTITSEYLDDIRDENASDEINYFSFCENIRTRVHEEFPEADLSMVEALIDEHLTKYI